MQSPLLSQIPNIIHGFGTQGEKIPQPLQNGWLKRPIVKQTHGTQCAQVTCPQQGFDSVDAIFTTQSRIPLAIITADCVPILLASKDGKAVAAIHAGWRGTLGKIACETWKEISKQESNPRQWVAAIGPAIGACCYEVSLELAKQFQDEFSRFGTHPIVTKSRYLDLPLINQLQLNEIGIQEVEILRYCTRCYHENNTPVFHSYRREKIAYGQFSGIQKL